MLGSSKIPHPPVGTPLAHILLYPFNAVGPLSLACSIYSNYCAFYLHRPWLELELGCGIETKQGQNITTPAASSCVIHLDRWCPHSLLLFGRHIIMSKIELDKLCMAGHIGKYREGHRAHGLCSNRKWHLIPSYFFPIPYPWHLVLPNPIYDRHPSCNEMISEQLVRYAEAGISYWVQWQCS